MSKLESWADIFSVKFCLHYTQKYNTALWHKCYSLLHVFFSCSIYILKETRKVDIPTINILLYAIFHMGQGEDMNYFVDYFSSTLLAVVVNVFISRHSLPGA